MLFRSIEIVPCIWNRPTGFARTVAERITDYGNSVFKIKRIGAKGDMKTTYDIMPANPQVYNEQAYPSDFSAFENFKPNNFAFIDRNFDELTQYVSTGVMPERQKAQTNEGYAPQGQTYGQQPQYNQGYQQPQGQYQAPQQNYGAPQGQYQQPQGYVNPQYGQQPQQTYQQPVDYQQAEANPFPQGQVQQQPVNQPQNQQPTQQPVGTDTKPNRRYY